LGEKDGKMSFILKKVTIRESGVADFSGWLFLGSAAVSWENS
jgi:hypothetical protein